MQVYIKITLHNKHKELISVLIRVIRGHLIMLNQKAGGSTGVMTKLKNGMEEEKIVGKLEKEF